MNEQPATPIPALEGIRGRTPAPATPGLSLRSESNNANEACDPATAVPIETDSAASEANARSRTHFVFKGHLRRLWGALSYGRAAALTSPTA